MQAQDFGQALAVFNEAFATYQRRLSGKVKSVQLRVHSSHLVQGCNTEDKEWLWTFVPGPAYRYPVTEAFPRRELGRLVEAGKKKPILLTIFDNLSAAVDELRRGEPSRAFTLLIPLLDIAFEGCESKYGGFNATAELGAWVTAAQSLRSHFRHLADYCRRQTWIYGQQPLIFGAATDEEVYDYLLDESEWTSMLEDCGWDALLVERRRQLSIEALEPQATIQVRASQYRADLARAVRSRHALAHRAQPLTDNHLLAVLVETLQAALWLRFAAARSGQDFGAAVARLVKECSGAGGPSADHRTLCLRGWG